MQPSDSPFSAPFARRMQDAGKILDQKTKPPGSLGTIENIAAQISAIQQSSHPDVTNARAIIFAADHGVVAESISAFPQSVSRQMLLNFVAQGAAANVLCKSTDTDLEVVNVGVIGAAIAGVVHAKIADGTANMAKQPAMSKVQLTTAIETGRAAIQRAAHDKVTLVALGEMGIGNTTAAAAIVSALCEVPAADSVGPGTGLDQQGVDHKVTVVNRILKTHPGRDPQECLQNMGGFELASLTGAMLEACNHGIVVVVDGYIVTAAALCAAAMQPSAREHMVFAHQSAERGHKAALKRLRATPILDLDLRLGEGSGAILAIPLIRSSVAILNDMATFDDAGVDREL